MERAPWGYNEEESKKEWELVLKKGSEFQKVGQGRGGQLRSGGTKEKKGGVQGTRSEKEKRSVNLQRRKTK